MIYIVLTEDSRYSEKPMLRMTLRCKIKNFYLVTYFDDKKEAEEFCRTGGKFPGTQEFRFCFYELKK